MNRDFIKDYPTSSKNPNEKISEAFDLSHCSPEFINYVLKAISLAPVNNRTDKSVKTFLQRSLSEKMPDPEVHKTDTSR